LRSPETIIPDIGLFEKHVKKYKKRLECCKIINNNRSNSNTKDKKRMLQNE